MLYFTLRATPWQKLDTNILSIVHNWRKKNQNQCLYLDNLFRGKHETNYVNCIHGIFK